MAAPPVTAAMPFQLDLVGGYILRVTALSPSTGLVVSGVNVSNVTFQVTNVLGGNLAADGFVPLPLLTPETP